MLNNSYVPVSGTRAKAYTDKIFEVWNSHEAEFNALIKALYEANDRAVQLSPMLPGDYRFDYRTATELSIMAEGPQCVVTCKRLERAAEACDGPIMISMADMDTISALNPFEIEVFMTRLRHAVTLQERANANALNRHGSAKPGSLDPLLKEEKQVRKHPRFFLDWSWQFKVLAVAWMAMAVYTALRAFNVVG